MNEKIHDKIKESRFGSMVYRNSLMGILAVTKAFENLDTIEKHNHHLPYRWTQLIDTLSASSTVAYSQISLIDEDVEADFRRKTRRIVRAMSDEKLYSEDEFEELCKRREEIEL